ncbi:MAG: glycerate kinase type-2 family protein [Terasakiella sp.]|uniref:glycerate kinase type-2 family protein n=1 Tax=unclassified Terasakiella TaxID=2614952 RepID=UPI003AFFD96A
MKDMLKQAFEAAVSAADPDVVLERYLPNDRHRKVTVVGAGKSAAKMAAAFERAWQGPVRGLVVTRYGHKVPTRFIEVVEAAHPVPDEAGLQAAKRILKMVSELGEDDLVVALISGGGSALLSLPAEGVSIVQKQAVNKALLQSGATIDEMNCVRKHLSAIKGGRLAKACFPAQLLSLAISDVPGDDPSVIASGPTVGDVTTCAEAREILNRYGIEGYDDLLVESVNPDDPCFARSTYKLIATPQRSLQAACDFLANKGISSLILSDRIEGEAREIAKMHGAIAQQIVTYGQPISAPCVLLSGGETTVSIRNPDGAGGPNAEFLLSLLDHMDGVERVYALAADTDGIDGSEDNAGAWIDPTSRQRAKDKGLKVRDYLDSNQSYRFFFEMDDLFAPGPTLTNVNDFRAIYIE